MNTTEAESSDKSMKLKIYVQYSMACQKKGGSPASSFVLGEKDVRAPILAYLKLSIEGMLHQ